MVNERRQHPAQMAQAAKDEQHPNDAVRETQTQRASGRAIAQPEFGKPSPLVNNVRRPNIFAPNPKRPEFHLPKSVAPPPTSTNSVGRAGHATLQPQQANVQPKPAAFGPVSRSDFYLPGQKRQQVQHASPKQQLSADFFEISKPVNLPLKDIRPRPRPMFSSQAATALGPNTNFLPFKPAIPRTPDNVIVIDDEDGDGETFNADAALREDRFGAVDPYMYLDPSKAGEDIKALLEGAFGDDEDRPRAQLRNRAKRAAVAKPTNQSLSDRLAQLNAKPANPSHVVEAKSEGPERDEEEDGTVEGMAVKLLPHQLEGVSWMLDKESGERKKNGVLPKGGILADDMGLGKTIQSVTLILTNPRPAQDAIPPKEAGRKLPSKEVGKGTLVVAPLALIRQWESEIKSKVSSSHALKVLVHHGTNRTKSHLELKKYDVVITTYQIIASEHAGSSDHDQGVKVGCFGVHWYRIILDEAHSIKNKSAKSTQACCALKGWYRWCLTGTPMQNNLDELQSLIHFLRIKPYCEVSRWKQQITGPMKAGKGHLAMKRVQYFLKAFMKRRTKDILKQDGALNFGGKKEVDDQKSSGMKIVERHIESVVCELDTYERQFYDRLAQRANDRLQDMMGGAKTDYIGALVLLLRLRQACNHPQLMKSSMSKDNDSLDVAGLTGPQTPGRSSSVDAGVDDLADLLGGLDVKASSCDICQMKLSAGALDVGAIRCAQCEQDVENETSRAEHANRPKKGAIRRARANRRIIDSDDDDEDADGQGEWLVSPSNHKSTLGQAGGTDDEDAEGGGHSLGSVDSDTDSEAESHDSMVRRTRRSTATPLSDSSDSDSSSSPAVPRTPRSKPTTEDLTSATYPSTKIRRLLQILKSETPHHKVIVFSQFTTMLDLIQPFLHAASLPYTRYDGSLRNDAREAALHALRTDPSVRILLCSLKCGSLGLNLTAASRVVIVEPFWNPFVEEQAIDRVHRLNQTVDVKVYKLTVRESVEERILELQDKKRELARQAIEGGKGAAKLSMRDLLGLFGGNFAGDEEGSGQTVETGKVEGGLLGKGNQGMRGTIAGPVAGPVANDARKRVGHSGARPRVSNEDPVYGRR